MAEPALCDEANPSAEEDGTSSEDLFILVWEPGDPEPTQLRDALRSYGPADLVAMASESDALAAEQRERFDRADGWLSILRASPQTPDTRAELDVVDMERRDAARRYRSHVAISAALRSLLRYHMENAPGPQGALSMAELTRSVDPKSGAKPGGVRRETLQRFRQAIEAMKSDTIVRTGGKAALNAELQALSKSKEDADLVKQLDKLAGYTAGGNAARLACYREYLERSGE